MSVSVLWVCLLFFDLLLHLTSFFAFFFFNDTATTEIYTLSLHDALPISTRAGGEYDGEYEEPNVQRHGRLRGDRKSTRLNSSHLVISYAVFCLKKKKKKNSNKRNQRSTKRRDNSATHREVREDASHLTQH